MKKKDDSLIVGLDIGTTKICCIISSLDDDGQVEIIGTGTSESKGLRKGVVINIEATKNSIQKAISEAELMAGKQVQGVWAGIAGGHIKSFNTRGVVAVSGKNKIIREADVLRVIDAAKAVAIPLDREVIHILPQEFIVDEQNSIKDPIGISGVRLEAEVHIVTGAVASAQNIIRSVNDAGYEVIDIVLEQLASAEAVLTQDEKDLGVALLDLGGGTTDLAIFVNGGVWHTSVLGLGGDHFTNDIAIGLRTPAREAERIKRKYGCALTSMVEEDETIEVPSVGGRKPRIVSRQLLSEIIEPRAQEIFSLIDRELRSSPYRDLLASGIVLTGGASIMEGLPEIAEDIFDMPVRRGLPMGVGGLVDVVKSPIYATGVGLVLYGSKSGVKKPIKGSDESVFKRVWARMKEFVEEFF